MMDGGMGSMMWLAWVAGGLVVILLIAVVIAAVRLLIPAGHAGGEGRAAKAILIVFAVIGAVALAAVVALGLMVFWGMLRGAMGL
jgi:fumarate reductase subunit D